MPQNVITIAKSNDPTKFVRTKTKLRKKSAVAINLNPVPSFQEEKGAGQFRADSHTSHFVSVLFKFHQLFGV